MKERLHKIADSVSRNLHVAVQCHTMAEGLVEQLENYLRMTPDTKLVIIDTLQKIRGENTDSSMYRADYTDISAIKALGDRLGVTFLLVHHLRKMPCLLYTSNSSMPAVWRAARRTPAKWWIWAVGSSAPASMTPICTF